MRESGFKNGAVTAKSESQTLVKANGNRAALYVANDGTNPVYLALGSKATANQGIRLHKESAPFRIEEYSGEVSCVTKEGESVVTFSEA